MAHDELDRVGVFSTHQLNRPAHPIGAGQDGPICLNNSTGREEKVKYNSRLIDGYIQGITAKEYLRLSEYHIHTDQHTSLGRVIAFISLLSGRIANKNIFESPRIKFTKHRSMISDKAHTPKYLRSYNKRRYFL